MPVSRSSHRAFSARRALAAELERLAGEVRGPVGRLEEALAALITGDGFPEDLAVDLLRVARADGDGRIPRIRPVLVHLATQVGAQRESDPEAALDVAVVTELLNAAIAVHDAALGRQDGRRRRAARRVLRSASHWLGGNQVTLRALEIARRAPAPEVLGDALDALREISEAQALAASFAHRPATPAEVLQHAEGHDGAVYAFACRAGAHLAGQDGAVVARLGRYGRHLGVGWQLAGDLAAFESEQGEGLVHRAAGGRWLYPVAWAQARDPEVRALWQDLAEAGEVAAVDELRERVRRTGGLLAGREALVAQAWTARLALGSVPEGPARDALDRIAATLVTLEVEAA